MKILVLSNLYPPDFHGGYELGCEQAVNALPARGHEVRVVTDRAGPSPDRVLASSGRRPGHARTYVLGMTPRLTNADEQADPTVSA